MAGCGRSPAAERTRRGLVQSGHARQAHSAETTQEFEGAVFALRVEREHGASTPEQWGEVVSKRDAVKVLVKEIADLANRELSQWGAGRVGGSPQSPPVGATPTSGETWPEP
jgi:hypothetical protein